MRKRSLRSWCASRRWVYSQSYISPSKFNPRPNISYRQIMAHVIDESTNAFDSTSHASDFFIFHDGRLAWWEGEAQAYLASNGFANRKIRNTTANKGARYEGKIVGDSPEMCHALDSHGFADLKAGLLTYAPFTSLYPEYDPAVSTSAPHPSRLLPSSAHGVSPPPARASLKISSSSPMCSVRSLRHAAAWCETRSFAVCDQVAGPKAAASQLRKPARTSA